MHEFFGASAVFELAEQAQQDAAQHLLAAFGTAGPSARQTSTQQSDVAVYPAGDGTVVVAPANR
jgi:hypothetical protein